MKQLLVYLKDYKKECILAPLFKMLEASFELFVPLVIAAIIDRGIGNNSSSYIYRSCGLLVMLGLIGLICAVTAQFFAAKAAVGFSTGLRHDLFSHLLGLSYSEIDTLGTSTMITRMTSDVNQAQTGVNMFLRLFLRSPFVVFGAMIMAFTIDVKAALVFVGVILLLSLSVGLIMKYNIPMLKQVQMRLDTVLSLTRENLSGVRVIRAFCKEEEEIWRFTEKNTELAAEQRKAGWLSGALNPLTYVIVNLAIICLIRVGAVQVNEGVLTQGQVVALYNYMSQILVELIKLANLIITLNKAIACGNRIADVLSVKNGMEIPSAIDVSIDPEAVNKVEFRHVSLRYHTSGDEALTDIDFTVKKGETIGIIGGTGSGKSSVINLIPRFYDATEGEVLVDGINVKEYPVDVLRQKIGVVTQKAVLFHGTIEENLRWGNEHASAADLTDAVHAAAADDVVAAKGGLEAEIAQGGRNLSGGQRQRLTIARALVRKPEILILDDSASALDLATDAKLRDAIMKLSYQPTVLIVSQRTSSIRHADQIIVLDDGAVAGSGTHEELLDHCSVYQEIYASQFKKEA
ncbi:MAG: ABC transporter ATP-binding protein [bacterium]|nr:ABC transporter ATP-binding protein [bacterium]